MRPRNDPGIGKPVAERPPGEGPDDRAVPDAGSQGSGHRVWDSAAPPLPTPETDEFGDEAGYDIVIGELLILDEAQKGELARGIAALLPRVQNPGYPRRDDGRPRGHE